MPLHTHSENKVDGEGENILFIFLLSVLLLYLWREKVRGVSLARSAAEHANRCRERLLSCVF